MIVVVDDDVSFAEEIQDLLALHGHQLVVVVTHPHASSLALLEHASLLILDLSLAATTALNVLDEVRRRGNEPAVVMVSGSGTDVLEIAKAIAIDRGFSVLGALPKPIVAEELLSLLARTKLAESDTPPPQYVDRGSTHAPVPSRSAVFSCASRSYVGSYFHAAALPMPPAILPPDPLTFLSCIPTRDARTILRAAFSAQQLLVQRGLDGFLVVQLPDAVMLDPIMRSDICTSLDGSQALRSRIVFELGPDTRANPLSHTTAMVDLRLAGYGLLMHAAGGDVPPLAAFVELPITIFAVDGALSLKLHPANHALLSAMDVLHRRAVATLCTGLSSIDDLQQARDFGFNLASIPSTGDPGHNN